MGLGGFIVLKPMSCTYKIGKLKNFIYLVKDLVYRTIDYKVYITSGQVSRLDADLITLNETESYSGRFKFTTTVSCKLNRVFDDSFIRSNQFKIIVEDQTGMQFLVSPEFDASYTSEFTIKEDELTYELTFNTQSNIPTRIVHTRITPTNSVEPATCKYNTTGVDKLFIGRKGQYSEVNFLTCDYTRTFDGEKTTTNIQFTIPIEDNDWHYDLIKFPSNVWNTKLIANGEEILDSALFPQYTRQTQEDSGRPDIFTITLKGVSGGSLLGITTQQNQYRWVSTSDHICDQFDKYVKESRQEYVDRQWVDTGEYRKGLLIQRNSQYCGYTPGVRYRWVTLDIANSYECVGTNKHFKQEQEISTDGQTWTRTGLSRAGDLYQANSLDCGYEVIEWLPVDGEYICEEYDPSVSWVLLDDEYYCELV